MLKKTPLLLFVHGWAFDSTIWNVLRMALGDWNSAVVEANYFSNRNIELFQLENAINKIDIPFILVGHSYGFMCSLSTCLKSPFCQGLICINGFSRFSYSENFPAGIASRILSRMLSRLKSNPKDVVNQFRLRCGAQLIKIEFQSARLLHDFVTMCNSDERQSLQLSNLPLLVLAGKADVIVSEAMTRASFTIDQESKSAWLSRSKSFFDIKISWHEKGGHLLPISDPKWCELHIRHFLHLITSRKRLKTNFFQRNVSIGKCFGAAADKYDNHAVIQRKVANQLAKKIATLPLPLPLSPRILEIGCGTGFLTQALSEHFDSADWTITDIAKPMVDRAKINLNLSGNVCFQVMDGENPLLESDKKYDLICSSLAMQWFTDLESGLVKLSKYLAPGGILAIATLACGTFIEWRKAYEAVGIQLAPMAYPAPEKIGTKLINLIGKVESECIVQKYKDGMTFLRHLKKIGANTPSISYGKLSSANLRRVIKHFTENGSSITYHSAYGIWQNPLK